MGIRCIRTMHTLVLHRQSPEPLIGIKGIWLRLTGNGIMDVKFHFSLRILFTLMCWTTMWSDLRLNSGKASNEDERVRCLETASLNRSWTAAGNSSLDRWHFVAPCILNSTLVSVCHLTASADTRTCTSIEITTNDWSVWAQPFPHFPFSRRQCMRLMEPSVMHRELQHNTGNRV